MSRFRLFDAQLIPTLRVSRWIAMSPTCWVKDQTGRTPTVFRRKVGRANRDLAVPARDIENEGRLAQAGVAPAQRAHELLALRDARAQMRGAAREVALVQVVR